MDFDLIRKSIFGSLAFWVPKNVFTFIVQKILKINKFEKFSSIRIAYIYIYIYNLVLLTDCK